MTAPRQPLISRPQIRFVRNSIEAEFPNRLTLHITLQRTPKGDARFHRLMVLLRGQTIFVFDGEHHRIIQEDAGNSRRFIAASFKAVIAVIAETATAPPHPDHFVRAARMFATEDVREDIRLLSEGESSRT